MKEPFRTLLFCGLLCLLLSFVLTASADDLPTNYAKALKYVKKNQPMEAVASNIGWNPKQLTELKAALPDGAVFHFTCKWNGIVFSDDCESLNYYDSVGVDHPEVGLRLHYITTCTEK